MKTLSNFISIFMQYLYGELIRIFSTEGFRNGHSSVTSFFISSFFNASISSQKKSLDLKHPFEGMLLCMGSCV